MTDKKFFIHLLGTHGSGKTTLSRHIGRRLGVDFTPGEVAHEDPQRRCLLLGKCSNRGKYLGMDGIRATQAERFQLIEDHWNQPHKLIMVDGSMLITWSSFFERYQHLPQGRKVWGIWLLASDEIIRERLATRGRTVWSEKKARSVRGKRITCDYVFKKALEVPSYRIERTRNHNQEQFHHIVRNIERITQVGINLSKAE